LVEYLSIGRILAPWGVKGQVKIEPLTDDIKRFENLKSIYIEIDNSLEYYEIENVLFLKDIFVVLKILGIDNIDSAEKFRGHYIKVHRKDAIKLPKNHYFICDIIGLKVFNYDGQYIGKVEDVIQTGANDVYIIKTVENKEVLIPAIRDVVLDIDLEKGKMSIRPLEGML